MKSVLSEDRPSRSIARDRAAQGYPTSGQATAILTTLVLATVFSYIDRTILSLLVAPIQRDMHVDDLQVSYLLGPTFAIFYALMGLPLGWAADRTRRLRLAAVGVALWSLMTTLSGLSHEFWQLFAARIGVAVGEAVLLPAATSLVVDSYFPGVRTRMLGLLGMSIYWGTGLAFVFGGLLTSYVGRLAEAGALPDGVRPWQLVLMLVGAPGLLVALVLALLREPKRQAGSVAPPSPMVPGEPSVPPLARLIADYGGLLAAFSLMAVVGYSIVSWAPSHLVRVYGWPAGTAGVRLGGGFLLATTVAIWLATWMADRLAARGHRDAKYLIGGCCTLLALPAMLAVGFVHDATVFVLATSLAMGAAAACIAIGPAAICEISVPSRRGRAVGIYQMVVGVIGGGLGPPAVALAARQSAGTSGGLGFALCLVASTGFLVATTIFWTRRHAFAQACLAAQDAERL